MALPTTNRCLDYLTTRTPKVRKQIIKKIKTLAENPFPRTAKILKGMTEEEERVYRLRSGDYRILYVVRNPIVVVIDINHRKDVYK